MGKLVKLLITIIIIAAIGFAILRYTDYFHRPETADPAGPDERPRVEEKFGFTSEGVGG